MYIQMIPIIRKCFRFICHFYSVRFPKNEKLIATVTIGAVIYLFCFGVAQTFFPVRPFWNDEWRLIFNIKFKNYAGLWGTLDLLQECPRTYLSCVKKISSLFDYSYTSLRLPALCIGAASVFLVFHLKNLLFPNRHTDGSLFVLILLSSQTFTDYLVQVKQYEMDIFLSLTAIWQLLVLDDLLKGRQVGWAKYGLLCATFAVVPFFSYVYPIAAAPITIIMVMGIMNMRRADISPAYRMRRILMVSLPAVLGVVATYAFYRLDVVHLMADKKMYMSYRHTLGMMDGETRFWSHVWNLFALVGSGLLFEIVFGILGIAAFFNALTKQTNRGNTATRERLMTTYGVLLLFITIGLLFSGKVMGGMARLTVFTVPSISFLIVVFLRSARTGGRWQKFGFGVRVLLFAALFGNILTTCINSFIYPEYADRIMTYHKTGEALQKARLGKEPILYTDGVRGDRLSPIADTPGRIATNTIDSMQRATDCRMSTEVMLKTHPEYKVWDTIPTYYIPDTKWATKYVDQLPPAYRKAMVCDGMNYFEQPR